MLQLAFSDANWFIMKVHRPVSYLSIVIMLIALSEYMYNSLIHRPINEVYCNSLVNFYPFNNFQHIRKLSNYRHYHLLTYFFGIILMLCNKFIIIFDIIGIFFLGKKFLDMNNPFETLHTNQRVYRGLQWAHAIIYIFSLTISFLPIYASQKDFI